MRIAIVPNTFLPKVGGGELYAYNLAKQLSGRGHEVTVITESRNGAKSRQRFGDVDVFRVPPGGVSQLLYAFFLFCTIIALHSRRRFQVLHAEFAFPAGLACVMASKVLNVPAIITVNGYDVMKEPSIRYGVRCNGLYDLLVRASLRLCDFVLPTSTALDKVVRALAPRTKTMVLCNGIDVHRYGGIRRECGTRILTVRQLVPKNGIGYLILAFAKLHKRHPQARLVIVGDGPQKQELEDMAKKLGVLSRVSFEGCVPNTSIASYYASSSVFVVPSIIEGQGIVILEAMASGVPVVATGVGGITDLVKEGGTGLLVEPANVDMLCNAIRRLLVSRPLRERLSRNGVALAKRYDWTRIAAATEDVYSRFVS